MNNRIFFVVIALLLSGGLFMALNSRTTLPEKTAHKNNRGQVHELVTYKSATCGCCGNWVGYMNNLGYKVEVVNTEEIDSIKEKYGIPADLYSCHTTIVNKGEYFIEGHIPSESIEKLLQDSPDIQGIGMAGMPSGSPGMPGAKEPFNIMKVDNVNTVSVYEVI